MSFLGWFISRRFMGSSASALTKRRRFYKIGQIIDCAVETARVETAWRSWSGRSSRSCEEELPVEVVDVVAEERQGKNLYKVTLDGRMLKTQAGNVLQIESEPLALAIAEEWASQDQHLQMGHMRLTGLAFTAQDNPLHLTRESITSKLLEYLHCDTVLFWNNETEKLSRYQEQYWKPVIKIANEGLGTSLTPSTNLLDSEVISAKDSRIVEKWLMSHNFWALTGLQYAVESLKSVLLPYSMVTFKLQAEEAVHHAMLEQKTQSETWGSVEWAHGMEEEELKTRVAASVLFVYFNSNAVTKRTP